MDPQETIPPDLAAKVLAADTRNAIHEVSEGGTLPAAHRKFIQNIAITPEMAAQQRVAALLSKWSSGQELTPSQIDEIRVAHPDFLSTDTPGRVESTAPPLDLTPSPSPTQGDSKLTRAQLDAWGKLYGVAHRQLRRWINRGRERNAPCPLDHPEQMPAWVEAHLEKVHGSMRDTVQAAADAAKACATLPVAEITEVDSEVQKPITTSATPTLSPLDLASVGGMEGETVQFFRTTFAAVKLQLEDAYKSGIESRIQLLHGRLERAGESLRKHELAAEAKARRAGTLLSKAEVQNDLTVAINSLKMMREHMGTRILSELPDLDLHLKEKILAAIESVRCREDDVLRNIGACKSIEDVFLKLAA